MTNDITVFLIVQPIILLGLLYFIKCVKIYAINKGYEYRFSTPKGKWIYNGNWFWVKDLTT